MGKEHDLLDAARTGNVAVIEKILSQRQKRMGQLHVPLALQASFASLTRSANPNCVDTNGDTPLHLAALNGHREAVCMLLHHGASANIADTKGCFPLHLAAWNGHASICQTLLTQGPSIAKVDELNAILETALHCASQYGHTDVVEVLLKYHADPTYQNHHQETALDLACQYGRLEAIQLLLRDHPTLQYSQGQSPLHLASRNGHRAVVSALLDAGFHINARTDSGSALHEASLFGKVDVVRLLLANDIDTTLTDSDNRTALDVLSEQKSHISLQIGNIILDHTEGEDSLFRRSQFLPSTSSGDSWRPLSADTPTSQDISDLYAEVRHHSDKEAGKGRKSETSMGSSSSSSAYGEAPPVPPKLDLGAEDSVYDVPVPSIRVQEVLKRNTALAGASLRPVSEPNLEGATLAAGSLGGSGCKSMLDCSSGKLQTPKKPPRRRPPSPKPKTSPGGTEVVYPSSEVVHSGCEVVHPSIEVVQPSSEVTHPSSEVAQPSSEVIHPSSEVVHPCNEVVHPDGEVASSEDITTHDVAQPLKRTEEQAAVTISSNVSTEGSTICTTDASVSPPAGKAMAHAAAPPVELITQLTCASPLGVETLTVSHSVLASGACLSPHDELAAHEDSQDGALKTASRPPSLQLMQHHIISELPLSPTGYAQPPTPDHPPPSPSTAVTDIQGRINPDEKRKSRDIETWTDAQFVHTMSPTTGEEGTKGTEEKCEANKFTKTELLTESTPEVASAADEKPDIEIVTNTRNAFLGLRKGSIALHPCRGSRLSSSDAILSRPHAPKLARRISAPSLMMSRSAGSSESARGGANMARSGANAARNAANTARGGANTARGGANTARGGANTARGGANTARGGASTESRTHSSGGNSGDAFLTETGTLCASEEEKTRESVSLDESEEWEKIADILSSCGGRMSMAEFNDYGYFEQRLLQIFSHSAPDGAVMQSVGDWLESIGLPQYENTLVANGFDDTDFMSSSILQRSDLLELNITNPDHQQCILGAASQLPDTIHKLCSDCSPEMSVDMWLMSLRLPDCMDIFQRHDLMTFDRLKSAWHKGLMQVLDVLMLGHRKRLVAALSALTDTQTSHSGAHHEDAVSMTTHCASDAPFTESTSHAAYRLQDEASGYGSCREDEEEEVSLSIRPPHHADAASPVKEWRHQPEVLVRGCCNYTAQYLGSTLVKNIQGIESTKDSITKMKKSFTNASKILIIILSISYQGVKFIDARSKRVICEHAISNIFCACQDGSDLRYFAYITKDLMSERHYCHVFSVRSTELAAEIILTLGESFEVAYQMALRGKFVESAQSRVTDAPPDLRPPVTETSF